MEHSHSELQRAAIELTKQNVADRIDALTSSEDFDLIERIERGERRKAFWSLTKALAALSSPIMSLAVSSDEEESDEEALLIEDEKEEEEEETAASSSGGKGGAGCYVAVLEPSVQPLFPDLLKEESSLSTVHPTLELGVTPEAMEPDRPQEVPVAAPQHRSFVPVVAPRTEHLLAVCADKVSVHTKEGDVLINVGLLFRPSQVRPPGAELMYNEAGLYFSYQDIPFWGWRKEVFLSSKVIDTEACNIAYIPPGSSSRLQGRDSIQEFLALNGYHESLILHFDEYPRAFCVCQQSCNLADVGCKHVECFIGVGGCGGWVHPLCVGIRRRARKAFDGVVCPLCTHYMQAAKQTDLLANKRVLNKLYCKRVTPLTYAIVDGFVIEEHREEHKVWGIEGSSFAFDPSNPINTVTPSPATSRFKRQLDDFDEENYARAEEDSIAVERPLLLDGSLTTPLSGDKKSGKQSKVVSTAFLSHELFAGILPVTVDVFNRGPSPSSLPFPQDTATPHETVTTPEPTVAEELDEVYDDSVSPDRRRKRATLDDGSTVVVSVRGGWMSEEYKTLMERYEQGRGVGAVARRGTLTDTYKRKLIDKCLSESRSDTFMTREAMRVSEVMSKPYITHLPVADGGLLTACVSTAVIEESFQPQCVSKDICAFCMAKLSLKSRSGNASKKSKSKRSSASTGKEAIVVGAMTFTIHSSCYQALSRANLFPEDWSEVIFVKYLHTYAKGADDDLPDCDICMRPGGLIYYFDILPGCTAMKTPTNEGWRGHIPCIFWLQKSQLLQKSMAHHRVRLEQQVIANADEDFGDDADVIVRSVLDSIVCRIEQSENGSVDKETFSLRSGSFDAAYSCWRCALCTSQSGLTIRCASIGCTVRAHFLCATTSDWFVFTCKGSAVGMLCPLHEPTSKDDSAGAQTNSSSP